MCSFLRLCVRSLVRSYIRAFVCWFVRAFVRAFVLLLFVNLILGYFSFFLLFLPFRSPALTFVVLLRSQREIVVTVFQRPIEMIMKGILLLISQISTSGPRAL